MTAVCLRLLWPNTDIKEDGCISRPVLRSFNSAGVCRLGAIEKLPLLYRKHSKKVRLLTILEPCAASVWRAYSAGPLGSRRDCARSLTFAVWRRVGLGHGGYRAFDLRPGLSAGRCITCVSTGRARACACVRLGATAKRRLRRLGIAPSGAGDSAGGLSG
jgi:hypothetical protein